MWEFVLGAVCCLLAVFAWIAWPRKNPPLRIPQADINWKSVDVDSKLPPKTGKIYLVTGGSGFLGAAFVDLLLRRGETNIRVLDLAPPPARVNWGPSVQFIKGSMTDTEVVSAAMNGVDTVFHIAAFLCYNQRMSFQRKRAWDINVGGTQALLDAAVNNKVPHFVYVSTSVVVVHPDLCTLDMDERVPFPKDPVSLYSETKSAAETMVRQYNERAFAGRGALKTVVVRPASSIFGAFGTTYVAEAIQSGKVLVLFPNQLMDYVHCDNVAYALLLAEKALRAREPGVAGETFIITNQQPMRQIDFAASIAHFAKAKLTMFPAPNIVMPILGHAVEVIHYLTRGRIKLGLVDQLTPGVLPVMSLTFTFDDKKARERLGYKPLYTVDEAMQKSTEQFTEYNKTQASGKSEPSLSKKHK